MVSGLDGSLLQSLGEKACLALLEATALEGALCEMQALGGRPSASSLLRACMEICWARSCSPWGGAWRLGWTPVECGSEHPGGTGSLTVLYEA